MFGFVSPDGKFCSCEYNGHMDLASDLLSKVYKQKSVTPVDSLCRRGWVVIQSSFVGFVEDNIHNVPRLTAEQKDWLSCNKDKMTFSQREGLDICLEINEVLYG